MLSKLLASWRDDSPEAIRRRLYAAHMDATYHLKEYLAARKREDDALAELRAATRPVPEHAPEPERAEVFPLPAGRPGWKPKARSKPAVLPRSDPADVWIER